MLGSDFPVSNARAEAALQTGDPDRAPAILLGPCGVLSVHGQQSIDGVSVVPADSGQARYERMGRYYSASSGG